MSSQQQGAPIVEPPRLQATRKENNVLMDKWWRRMEAAEAEGRPVANVFVMGSIAEILECFDIPMSFPEITSLQTAFRGQSMEYLLEAEDYGYSPDICGYVKVDVGVHLKEGVHPMGKLPKPSLVVSTNMCNTYIKWSEIWERMFEVPVFQLDLPGYRGTGFKLGGADKQAFENDRKYVEVQLRELIALCEKITGKKFDIDKLRSVMGEVNKMAVAYQELLALNRHVPAPFNAMKDGVVFMGIANAWRGTPEGARFMEIAVQEMKERVQNGVAALPGEKFRLLFVGTTCYVQFRRFMQLFEDWGGIFVHNEYMTYAGGGIDRGIQYDLNRPLESLAEQILLTSQQSMSSIFFSENWQQDVVRDWKIDGIVFHGVKSCRTTSTGLADYREWQAAHNVPALLIESDLVDARLWSEAQMKNRIDAYFEALAGRKAAAAAGR